MVKMISILFTDHLNQADPELPFHAYRYILLAVKSELFVLFWPLQVIWTTVIYYILYITLKHKGSSLSFIYSCSPLNKES